MSASKHAGLAHYERKHFFSKDGYEVSIGSDKWRLNKDVSFRIDLPEWIGPDIESDFRQVLSVYGVTCSANYTASQYRRIRSYFLSTSPDLLFTPASMISYRAELEQNAWEMSYIRAFSRTWIGLGYPGIPAETLAMMEKWRIKGNEKGYAVQSQCPESGPLTDIEMSAVVSRVIEYYAAGRIGLRGTCYTMILAMTGRRPIQIAALKIKDLMNEGGKYSINFPRAKQRNGDWRSSFRKIPIIEDLWLLLKSQAEQTKTSFEEKVGKPLDVSLIPELPLFPSFWQYDGSDSLESQLQGDFLHARTMEVSESLRSVKEVIDVISERTGAVINLNPYRFRYTLGTNLAREGRGEYIIAEALDHSDIQNSGVYVKNIPEIVKHIDKAVALSLAPLAQAFQGVLVPDERKAQRGGDRSSRICSSAGNVGTCGSYGFCGALAPIACYTCVHFQPWLHGPHEFVLDQLIAERDNVIATTGDLKIASVNDRLILAVSDVVSRCNAIKCGAAHV